MWITNSSVGISACVLEVQQINCNNLKPHLYWSLLFLLSSPSSSLLSLYHYYHHHHYHYHQCYHYHYHQGTIAARSRQLLIVVTGKVLNMTNVMHFCIIMSLPPVQGMKANSWNNERKADQILSNKCRLFSDSLFHSGQRQRYRNKQKAKKKQKINTS